MGLDATSASTTSATLLARLKNDPTDSRSWSEFVDRYGTKVHRWCLRWGLQEADAADVTQTVMLALAKQMRTFEYRPGGRFRSWLKTIANRAWIDFLESRRRRQAAVATDPAEALGSAEARDDLIQRFETECDRELLEVAMRLVEPRVKPHTWQAFRLMTFDRLPAAEVAERLDMKEGSVFVARSRVQKMLADEVARLDSQ